MVGAGEIRAEATGKPHPEIAFGRVPDNNKPPSDKESGSLKGAITRTARLFAKLKHLQCADGNFAGAGIFCRVEAHLLTFYEPENARALKRRGMHENVIATIIRSNKAEALLAIVELNGAGIHIAILPSFLAARMYKNHRRASYNRRSASSNFGESLNVHSATPSETAPSSGQSRVCFLTLWWKDDKGNLCRRYTKPGSAPVPAPMLVLAPGVQQCRGTETPPRLCQ
jgi:hypothetical protein